MAMRAAVLGLASTLAAGGVAARGGPPAPDQAICIGMDCCYADYFAGTCMPSTSCGTWTYK